MPAWEHILYEIPANHVARIVLNRVAAFNHAFALHQLGHSHNQQVHGMAIDPSGIAPTITRNAAES